MRAKIKDKLISKIKGFEDAEILEEIYSWLEDESAKAALKTTAAQKIVIREGIQQMKEGQVITSKKADQEIDQWLRSID